MRWALLAGIVVAACGFRPNDGPQDAPLACGGGCDAPNNDAGSDTGIPEANCGRATAFRDNFDTLNQWRIGVNTLQEPTASVNGEQVTIAPDRPTPGTIDSNHIVDLRESSIEVQVVAIDSTGDAATQLLAGQDAMHYVRMYVQNSVLIGEVTDMMSKTMTPPVTYDPVADAYWQIVETGQHLTFQTSINGTTWTTLAGSTPIATPPWASAVRLELSVLPPGGTGGNGSATFAAFNETAAASPWCSASTPIPWMPPSWMNSVMPKPPFMCMAMYGLAATVSAADPTDGDCYIGSSEAYDLRNTSLIVDVDPIGSTVTWSPYVEIVADDGDYTGIVYSNDAGDTDLCFPFESCSHPYSPTNDRYWRLTESAGVFTISTGSDGMTWTSITNGVSDPFDMSEVEIELGATFDSVEPAAPLVTFDSEN